ncbi:eCIS core domain-containing protein [Streptomyces odonnellii]|uniref:eCIS core domain-containing protein n=1 Tax=Streptomyces odonnellii TaxID=1417980 RepID=UPI000B2B21D3
MTVRELRGALRAELEALFGASLRGIRVHESGTVPGGRPAMTWGDDLFFAPGAYRPHTRPCPADLRGPATPGTAPRCVVGVARVPPVHGRSSALRCTPVA